MSERESVRERLQAIAREVDDRLPMGYGFIVLAFPFDTGVDEHRVEYCSNGKREDVIKAMKEFIDKNKNPADWAKHN